MKGQAVPQVRGSATWLVSGAAAVLFVYSLPFFLSHFQRRQMPIAFGDEKIYLARVMDAYRGGSLGNPYLADHESAARFMPELAERLLAFTARVIHSDPLVVVGASRVILPVLIYFLLWNLSRYLGTEPRFSMLAAMLPPLSPSISWIGSVEPPGTGFFRYFRAISPAFYVLLLVLILRVVLFSWKKDQWWAGLLPAFAIGILFYISPLYYWSFAIAGLMFMALITGGRIRVNMLTAVGAACILAIPFLLKASRQGRLPAVQQTLARLDLLIPGRLPDLYVTRTFVVSALALIPIWLWRHKLGDAGRFVLPFMWSGTLLMVQNLVTNRHVQGYHWVECLVPIWSLAAVSFFQLFSRSVRPPYFTALILAVIVGAIVLQTIAYSRLEESQTQDADFWALDALMPNTLDWLNRQTPAGAVVIADMDVMDSLVLYTHNKVYWADYAGQHVMLESEVQARTKSSKSFRPSYGAGYLPFRADFYVGMGPPCFSTGMNRLMYHNKAEGTCVLRLLPENGNRSAAGTGPASD